MKKLLIFNARIFISLLLLLAFESCDRNCKNDDCPTDQFYVSLEVIDSLGRNCVDVNPEFEAILFTSNDLHQDEVVANISGDIKLNVQSDISEYMLKYNQTEFVMLNLEGDIETITCCDNRFMVLQNYELINRSTDEVVCANCVEFQLLIPSCD